jgi:hypothetical protein
MGKGRRPDGCHFEEEGRWAASRHGAGEQPMVWLGAVAHDGVQDGCGDTMLEEGESGVGCWAARLGVWVRRGCWIRRRAARSLGRKRISGQK